MFFGLSALVVEDVVVVTARTREDAVPCPVRGTPAAKVHRYHGRTVTDVPVDGRQVVVRLRIRRLVCPVQTFRDQIPGLLERHQRRRTW
ncbi:transposase family protein [Streptomyces sp. NPDC004227]